MAMTPTYDPSTDPAFQELLNQLGLRESLYRNQATAQIGQYGNQAALTTPRIQEQGIEQRRNIDNSFEERGMYRSGDRLRALAIQQRGEQERLGDVQTNLANRTAGINRTLDQQLADLAGQRATAVYQAKLAAA